ncbi:MAG: copper oxidase [Rhodothermales bacterium]
MSSFSRRDWMKASAAALGGAALGSVRRAAALPAEWDGEAAARALEPAAGGAVRPRIPDDLSTPYVGDRPPRVHTPNGSSITGRRADDGAWVYHLVAEEVQHEFAPGLTATCWGYNGQVHGPTFEAVEGDTVRVYVTNRLPVATTVHWHGFFLPNGMDGVGGLNQPVIPPGETFVYTFPIRQNGTFMYHSHHDEMTQIALGLTGMFVVHPNTRGEIPEVDRDFAIMLHEWAVDPGTSRPDPNEMSDFNVLTMNARAFPGTDPLVVGHMDRVRLRFGNLSPMDHHPIHLHGHYWKIVGTDGGRIPEAGQWPETTVLVPVGSTRTVEFTADALGDWAMHCHMTHHVMNQMGHEFPNMVGVDAAKLDREVRPLVPGYMTMGQVGGDDMGAHVEMGHMPVPENSIPMVGAAGPFGYITMGGMYTNMLVRPRPVDYDRFPGWYEHPPGTVAHAVSAEVAARDGVRV